MFKLDRKSIVSLSLVATAAIFTACQGDAAPEAEAKAAPKAATGNTFMGKATIDGGKVYPIENGKTSVYYVNEEAHKTNFNYGRTPTADELKAWNTDVTPWKKPPPGKGTAEEGEEVYEAQCVMCHADFGAGGAGYPALSKGNAYELQKTLTNNRWKDPEADGPTRVFGSYWPVASTLWWYIHDGMPHPKSKTLTPDEVYALTAYIYNLNELEFKNGEAVEEDTEINQDNIYDVVMPNADGFEPNIKGPNALEDVRAYYAKASNFGAQNLNQGAVRCVTDCQKPTAKVVRIKGAGISDFNPPMSTVRDLPKEKAAIDPAQVYKDTCAMCHSSYLAKGNEAEWAPYLAKGMDKVYANAINGTEGGMPPKGGTTLSDADFKTVVDYITSK